MNHCKFGDNTAQCSGASVCAAWLDSGITPGLIVVDSNRPSTSGVFVGALHLQFVAAH
jgi:hypothetical protein